MHVSDIVNASIFDIDRRVNGITNISLAAKVSLDGLVIEIETATTLHIR